MKKAWLLGGLGLLTVLALGFPSTHQEVPWPQFKGFDVPFVPTPPEVVDEMLRLADLRAGDTLYDLGCGDGRIVIAAAKRSGIRAIGIDIDPVRITESNENAAKAGVAGKVRFIQQDLFEADFRDASVVTMYLLTSVNLRLRPKLLAELRPGTRLVSHSFDMGDWKPDKTNLVKTAYSDRRTVHFWVVPANVSGRWEWDLPAGAGRRRYMLQVDQKFQVVGLSATSDGWPLTGDDVILTGDLIKFRLTAEADGKMISYLYEGKALGDRITGTVKPADRPKAAAVKWQAARDPKTAVPLDH
jgi:SAM-dependent methyltransferase